MANGTQYSFQRIEKKYFISPAQMEALLNEAEGSRKESA